MADHDDRQVLDINQPIQCISRWETVSLVEDDDHRTGDALLKLDTKIFARDVHRRVTTGEIVKDRADNTSSRFPEAANMGCLNVGVSSELP